MLAITGAMAWATDSPGTDAETTTGGWGKMARTGRRQAAHLAPTSRLTGPSNPPAWMVWGPSAVHRTMGWDGLAA